MKKLVIYLLCFILFIQSSIGVYAEEINNMIEQHESCSDIVEEAMKPETEKTELESQEAIELETEKTELELQEETEPETEEIIVEEEHVIKTETLEDLIIENDDPQYGRENGYVDTNFYGISAYSGEELKYIHNSRFDRYIIKDVIDVSVHQGDIDWAKVKQSGIDYAMIRVGFRGYGETGSLNMDSKFVDNMQGALAAGQKVGVYFFSQAITEEEAKAEAEYVLNLIKDYEISLPVVIDFEYASSEEGLTGRLYDADLSVEAATAICRQFCEIVESHNYTAMVYANRSMLEDRLNASELEKDYKIWLANYVATTSYEGKYDFWQYTQSATVEGISGSVDKSFWYEEPEEEEIIYAEISEGIYTITSCLDSNKVIDIPNASLANGVNAQIFSNNDTWAQKFYIRLEGEDTYVVMSANSGKVLSVNGSSICQQDYTGLDEQQWRFRKNEDGSYTAESMVSDMVVDVAGGQNTNGTRLQLYKSNGTKAQCFLLNKEADSATCTVEDGVYFIETNLLEDKVINLKSDGIHSEIKTIDGTKAQKFQLKYLENGCYQIVSLLNQKVFLDQQWIIKKSASNTYSFISAKDGKNLDVAGAEVTDGTMIQKFTGNGTEAQKFKLYETTSADEVIEDGIYVIHSALNYARVLDVSNASKECDANVQLYTVNGTNAQKFIVKRMQDESYSIYSFNSKMAVAVKDGLNANGANVLQYFPVGGEAQEWDIISKGKGYYNITSHIGGKALDVAGAETVDGTNIQIFESNGTNAQKFRFEKVGEIDNSLSVKLENGTYTICSSLDESKVLDITGGSLYLGANTQLFSSNNTAAQLFVIQQNSSTGLYTITSKKSGMRLTYANESLGNPTNVYQDTPLNENANQWNLRHLADDYYMIYAADSSLCMDVTGGIASDGTNIQIYHNNGSKAQIFKLNKINNQVLAEQDVNKKLKDGIYIVSTSLDSSMVLDAVLGSGEEGANVQLYKRNNALTQKYIVQQLENGKYMLTALCSGKSLTVNGTNVCQQTYTGNVGQQWEIIGAGDGYYTLKSVQNGQVLDVEGGLTSNGANIQIFPSNFTAAQRFKFTQVTTTPTAKFIADGSESYKVHFQSHTFGNESSTDNKYYLMQADCYSDTIYGNPLTSVDQNYEVSISLSGLTRSKLKELAMDKLVLAVKLSDGTYKAITDPVSISNLDVIAQNTAPIFKGTSKKGLQGIYYAAYEGGNDIVDARNANTKQTLLNLDLASVVSTTLKAGYEAYTYKGNTYYFSKLTDLKANIQSLNYGYKQYLYGNSGTTPVAVTLCLLLSYNSENSFLIDPAGRTPGHSYYMLNVREEKARETLEALFLYLGETFGQSNCYVSNWVLGNEINSSRAWNYSGGLDFNTYMECYATAFRLLYNGVKSEKTGNNVCISLDNGWTAAPDTYEGKTTLDTFAQKIHAQNPKIDWSIAYHAYSYPLTRADFWNDYTYTTDSLSTPYISMRNISVLTNYAGTLESTYGKASGSIRVLLTEQGYSYHAGAEAQAMAIARGFYIAQFNNRIDAFIIRAVVDDSDEATGGLYFGLMNIRHDKRIAFYVYEHMDSDLSKFGGISADGYVSFENYAKFNKAKEILCNTNWKGIVPGFDAAKLASIK